MRRNKKQKIVGAHYERNYVYKFYFHLVFVTKYRHQIFTNQELINEMKSLLTKIAQLNEITINKIEIMSEHVHMMISFKPKLAPANVVKALKGGSGRLFLKNHPNVKRDKFWEGHIWSHNYFMSTVGDMSKATIEKYIANQYSK